MKLSLSLSDEVHGALAKASRRAQVPMMQAYRESWTKQGAGKFVPKVTMFIFETDFTMSRLRSSVELAIRHLFQRGRA